MVACSRGALRSHDSEALKGSMHPDSPGAASRRPSAVIAGPSGLRLIWCMALLSATLASRCADFELPPLPRPIMDGFAPAVQEQMKSAAATAGEHAGDAAAVGQLGRIPVHLRPVSNGPGLLPAGAGLGPRSVRVGLPARCRRGATWATRRGPGRVRGGRRHSPGRPSDSSAARRFAGACRRLSRIPRDSRNRIGTRARLGGNALQARPTRGWEQRLGDRAPRGGSRNRA